MSLASSLQSQFIASSHQLWQQVEARPRIHVEALAAAVVSLQLLQLVVHHARSRAASHWSLRWAAWASYYLPVPLAAMAAAAMLRFPCPCWLVAVFFAAGQADTMAAYSLRDAEMQTLRRLAKRGLSLAFMALALFVGDGGSASRRKEVFVLALGFLIVLQDLKIRSRAVAPPSEICKIAADHVRFPARRRRSPYADVYHGDWDHDRRSVVAVGSLESYRSAVSGCMTLEDIREMRRSRRYDYDDGPCWSRTQGACLSSALFLQLLERHGNDYDRPQVLERSSANHAFRDVLAEDPGYWEIVPRAFKIVEVQLSFMRDYFFSAHGSPSRTSYKLYIVYSLLKITFLLTVRSLAMEEEPSRVASASLYGLIFLEICQIEGYLTSNRFIVSYMCDRRTDLRDTADGFRDNLLVALPLILLGALVGSQRQVHLGRYSLVDDFDRTCLLRRLVATLLGRRRHGQPPATPTLRLGSSSVKRPEPSASDRSWQFDHLKRWICDRAAADSEGHGGSRFAYDPPLIGASDPLSWSLQRETKIHTILIWHVATWFCDMAVDDVKLLFLERMFPGEYTYATALSGYCAYLVASRPELLHEHPALTASIFEEAVKEAKLHFNGVASSGGERYAMAKTWRVQYLDYRAGILLQGVRLGQQLMQRGSSERWKIMADFWAEMVLFVAQSGNAAAHVEHLAAGDELVTQLWAFLSNGWDRTFIRRRDGGTRSDPMLQLPRQFVGLMFEMFALVSEEDD